MWRWRTKSGDDAAEPSARSGAATSAVVHLALIAACVLYANARPFESQGDQTIAVDIVTPPEVETPPPPKPAEPALDLKPAEQPSPEAPPTAASPPPTASKQAAAPPPAPQKPAKQPPAPPQQQQAAVQQPPPSPPPPIAPSAYSPPEPDITVKYGVDLGLMGLAPAGGKDDFDSQASSAAKVAKQDVAAFRAKLKSCGTLPAAIAPDDRVVIKLRAMFTPDGRLARAPVLIEASASAKGPLLMQAAIAALEACQPYAMLPADKYDEWKILDLPFTPQDFGRG